jgi:histidine ammonia-lyase
MTALRIGDEPLTPAAVAAAARAGTVWVELTAAARERMAAGKRTAEAVAARRPVYGFTTGVGANRHVGVDGDLRAHALRLLRSHAGGIGDELAPEVVRATVLVRVAQLAAGGSGIRPEVADALAGLLAEERLPVVRDLGGIGTGDLTVLAQLGLALAGEAPEGGPARLEIGPGDALPLMSSNAATFATAVLAWDELAELLDAGLGVAAVTFAALHGNGEAFAEPLSDARPLPGLAAVCGRLRALTAGAAPAARIQDPFGLRTLPHVAGALHGALASLHDVLAVEINAAAENPLFAGDDALHHGGFHAAACALALDALRLALVPFGALAGARLSHLMEPRLTGLTPFLSAEAPGSSGTMIAEYIAGDALARLRTEAAPAVLGSIAISRGLEEHASFAWQAAGQARRAAVHLRTVLALEWVAAERALRMGEAPVPTALAGIRELAGGFGTRLEDRPLAEDVVAAQAALPRLAGAVRAAAEVGPDAPGEPLHRAV